MTRSRPRGLALLSLLLVSTLLAPAIARAGATEPFTTKSVSHCCSHCMTKARSVTP